MVGYELADRSHQRRTVRDNRVREGGQLGVVEIAELAGQRGHQFLFELDYLAPGLRGEGENSGAGRRTGAVAGRPDRLDAVRPVTG